MVLGMDVELITPKEFGRRLGISPTKAMAWAEGAAELPDGVKRIVGLGQRVRLLVPKGWNTRTADAPTPSAAPAGASLDKEVTT